MKPNLNVTILPIKLRIHQAVCDIVTYATLPPQIDYVKPYLKKEIIAYEFLDTLPIGIRDKYITIAQGLINAYYEPCFTNESGESFSVAELDSMF
jgi:hypothetical protein